MRKSKAAPRADSAGQAVFRPAWWLPGGHLPTLFGKLRAKPVLPALRREHIPLPDGDRLVIERFDGDARAPRLVVFHGLEGGLHSTYARGLMREAAERRWWADLVLWRTCDGVPVNGVRRSYHSGASDDAGSAIAHILANDPVRPVAMIGVSLGGNVMLKWLGEQGAAVHPAIRAAAGVSVPFDLADAAAQTERGFSRVYGRFFLNSLRAKTRAKLAHFPDLIDPAQLRKLTTLREFDDAVTAPAHGFLDAADYYAKCSSLRLLPAVRIPTLLLCANNDPFLSSGVLSQVRHVAEDNANLSCVFVPGGGHVGFVAGTWPWRARPWMESYTLDWLAHRLAN